MKDGMRVMIAYDGSAHADASLSDLAAGWSADSIFIGSHGLDRPLDRSGLGGVAAALVTGAPCSVEVVR